MPLTFKINRRKFLIKKEDGKELNLQYTRGITHKRVTSRRAHRRDLAPGQHSSKETSQRRRTVDDTAFKLTGLGIEPPTSSADSDVFIHCRSATNINKILSVGSIFRHFYATNINCVKTNIK